MLQGQAAGAKLLRVYQPFQGKSWSSGAEFPPRNIFHDIKQVKYFGSKLQYNANWADFQMFPRVYLHFFAAHEWIRQMQSIYQSDYQMCSSIIGYFRNIKYSAW